jgi:hypothetical protein
METASSSDGCRRPASMLERWLCRMPACSARAVPESPDLSRIALIAAPLTRIEPDLVRSDYIWQGLAMDFFPSTDRPDWSHYQGKQRFPW